MQDERQTPRHVTSRPRRPHELTPPCGFGGREVLLILERDKDATSTAFEYKLIAASKTSALQKELSQAGDMGYAMVGLTVAQTTMGGKELVAITRRPRSR